MIRNFHHSSTKKLHLDRTQNLQKEAGLSARPLREGTLPMLDRRDQAFG
jgi:hypothetical protein